jgi:hypothetical protein
VFASETAILGYPFSFIAYFYGANPAMIPSRSFIALSGLS